MNLSQVLALTAAFRVAELSGYVGWCVGCFAELIDPEQMRTPRASRSIKTTDDEMATLKQEIAKLDTSVADATAARKAEHSEFTATTAELQMVAARERRPCTFRVFQVVRSVF